MTWRDFSSELKKAMSPYYTLQMYHINRAIAEDLIQVSERLDVPLVDPSGRPNARVISEIFSELASDLRSVERGSDSPLDRAYTLWPLTHPDFDIDLEKYFGYYHALSLSLPVSLKACRSDDEDALEAAHEHLKTAYLTQFLPSLDSLKASIKDANLNPEKIQLNLEAVMSYALQEENGRYNPTRLLLERFTPKLSSFLGSDFSDPKIRKDMLKEINFVQRYDTCVYSFRKKGFLNISLCAQLIAFEMNSPENIGYLIRGTRNINEDSTRKITSSGEAVPHSLSFGLSLFEGVFHDLTAMVNHYARRTSIKDVYIIPFDKYALIRSVYQPSEGQLASVSDCHEKLEELLCYDQSVLIPIKTIHHTSEFPFYIPPLPTLLQLFGIGEVFHPRTKFFLPHDRRDLKDAFVSGLLNCSNFKVPEFLLMTDVQDSEYVEDLFRSFLSFGLTLKK